MRFQMPLKSRRTDLFAPLIKYVREVGKIDPQLLEKDWL